MRFATTVRALYQLSEPSFFQAQSVVNVGNHLLEGPAGHVGALLTARRQLPGLITLA
jgi:hypothetical protein